MKRLILLAALIGVGLAFLWSEQFGSTRTKVVSVDFSPDGRYLAIARNHAVEQLGADSEKYLAKVSRSIHLWELSTHKATEILRQPVPAQRVADEEWLRILGQKPNYEKPMLPFSPVQFLPRSGRLAYVDFSDQSIQTLDLATGQQQRLAELKSLHADVRLTPGWFRVMPDEESMLVEDDKFNLYRYRLEDGQASSELPLGNPFYINSQNLSLGPFIELRLLGRLFETPRPIYGASRHPKRDLLAVASVSQICLIEFDGRIPRRLIAKNMKIGSTVQYFPDGKKMVALYHDMLRFYDVEQERRIDVITNQDKFMTAFAISPDGKRFATGDNHGVVRIWDGDSFNLLSSVTIDGGWRLDWRVPYILGFAWCLVAVITFGFEPFRRRQAVPIKPTQAVRVESGAA